MRKSSFFAVGARAVPLVLGLVLSMLFAVPAGAHTSLKSSDPAKNAEVETLSKVTLEFTESVRFPVVIVNGPGGERFESGAPVVKGPIVTQDVAPSLPPGKYTIAYRVVSADGHPVDGEIPFTVVAPAATDADESPSPSDSPEAADTPSADAAPPAAPEGGTPAATDAEAAESAGASEVDSGASIPGWVWAVVLGIAGVGIGLVLSLRKKS